MIKAMRLRPLRWLQLRRPMSGARPSAPMRLQPRAALLLVPVLLAACVVVPQTREVYDPDCRVMTRQMTLEAAYIGGFQRCAGEGCLALLTAAGAVTAASAVVSGSIALVGNVVYWFERQGQCNRAPAALRP